MAQRLDTEALRALMTRAVLPLRLKHKVAISDLITAWATAERQLAMLQMAVLGIGFYDIVNESLLLNVKERMKNIRKAFIANGYDKYDKLIVSYDKWISDFDYSVLPRHLACHSCLYGYDREDHNYLIFDKLEKRSNDVKIFRLHVDDFKRSTQWAEILAKGAFRQREQLEQSTPNRP